jgi:hypothetical protein
MWASGLSALRWEQSFDLLNDCRGEWRHDTEGARSPDASGQRE